MRANILLRQRLGVPFASGSRISGQGAQFAHFHNVYQPRSEPGVHLPGCRRRYL